MDKFTEHKVINWLYPELGEKGHEPIVPNTQFWQWESDVISVTKAGYIYEYEIKTSRADFLADAKKTVVIWNESDYINPDIFEQVDPVSENKKSLYRKGRARLGKKFRKIDVLPYLKKGPTCFFYVVPEGTVESAELPDYAGLIEYKWIPEKQTRYGKQEGYMKFYDRKTFNPGNDLVKPKRMNSRKINEKQENKLLRKLFFRYWNERRREQVVNGKVRRLRREKRRAENAADRYKERYQKWMNKFCDLKEQMETQKEG